MIRAKCSQRTGDELQVERSGGMVVFGIQYGGQAAYRRVTLSPADALEVCRRVWNGIQTGEPYTTEEAVTGKLE